MNKIPTEFIDAAIASHMRYHQKQLKAVEEALESCIKIKGVTGLVYKTCKAELETQTYFIENTKRYIAEWDAYKNANGLRGLHYYDELEKKDDAK